MVPPPAPPSAPTPRLSLALTCLLLSPVLPLGLVMLALRYVVASQPALHPVPSALNLILEGGTSVVILLGIPASSLAIGLGHIALGQGGKVPSGRRVRYVARTGLALGYGSLGAVLALACITAFSLGTHRMHLVW
ncbi:MAG TPA: hypothetical protein VFU88_08925 [Ktedonobacterales bacterium]|nr:hypothetical protein [Ktedonobacterales bacterium]